MTKISLKGDLSINDAEELQKVFISASEKKVDIELDVSQLEDVDTTIIQLIYALYHAAKDRTITVTGPVSNQVRKRLYICGIIPSPDLSDSEILKHISEKMGDLK